jgi:predicted Zn finger-like uncharacterized protein
MRIVCPSCSAAYEIPDGMLAAGQAVRCARCGEQWQPVDAGAPVAAAPVTSPPPDAAPARPAVPEPADPASLAAPTLARPGPSIQPRLPPRSAPPRPAPPRPAPPRPAVPAWPREGREARQMPEERENEWGALAIDRLMGERPPPRRGGLGLQLAWVLSVVVIVAALVAAYAWRDAVMTAWPASARLYAALGLDE